MQIFGRTPAFWTGAVQGVLALLLSLDAFDLTDERVSLIMAVVIGLSAVYEAYVTKETALSAGVGLAKAVLALAIGYGATLSVETTSALIALVTIGLGAFNHTQNSPLVTPAFDSAPDAPVLTQPSSDQPVPSAAVLDETGVEGQFS